MSSIKVIKTLCGLKFVCSKAKIIRNPFYNSCLALLMPQNLSRNQITDIQLFPIHGKEAASYFQCLRLPNTELSENQSYLLATPSFEYILK